MEGYKLPKKKPHARRSRLVSSGSVQETRTRGTGSNSSPSSHNSNNNSSSIFEGKHSDNNSNSIGSRPSLVKSSHHEDFRAKQKQAQLDAMMAELEAQSSSDDDSSISIPQQIQVDNTIAEVPQGTK